jgi:dGTPase
MGFSEKSLSNFAIKSAESKGRKFKESFSDDNRTCFQRDRDRIIHSKAFRRLDQKTQVFVSGSGDHFRTRLTHTLEVMQMSRDIARRLGLNEDLCEVIALAHDLGHPPFGHAGEAALDKIMKEHGLRFEHNQQSLRVVEKLEKSYPNFDGLNLSLEVLEGLMKHQSPWDQEGHDFDGAPSLEAQVVNLADEIAYTNHDIDDGLRSGLISLDQLNDVELWKMAKDSVFEKYGEKLEREIFISRIVSAMISLMIEDVCENEKGVVRFSDKFIVYMKEIRDFLYKNFYLNPIILKEVKKGEKMIKELFEFYLKKGRDITELKDYIAGMTDSFLLKEYEKHIIKS